MTLADHIRAKLGSALDSIPPVERPRIYAVSMNVYDVDDDPRRPVITVGYNTEQRVEACTPAPGQEPRWPIASGADEARWNYAFWLQNVLSTVCDETADPAGAALRDTWAKQRGLWYSDEEEARDLGAALARVEPLTGEFVQLCVRAVRSLHDAGDVARLFGRPVPVLIHELEYYDEIADQNEAANPPELVRDFSRWVRGDVPAE